MTDWVHIYCDKCNKKAPIKDIKIFCNKTKQFEPDFRSIPNGGLTYNPKDGFAYKNEDGQFIKLNPFTLEPVQSIDGTE